MMKAVLPAMVRTLLEPRLPTEVEAVWFTTTDEAEQGVAEAEIAWLDVQGIRQTRDVARHARRLKWLFTMAAGVEYLDLAYLDERGVLLTNGSGLNAADVAD